MKLQAVLLHRQVPSRSVFGGLLVFFGLHLVRGVDVFWFAPGTFIYF